MTKISLPKPDENRSFQPAPAGLHPARCIRLVDLGTQPRSYMGEAKSPARTIKLTFELVDELMEDGRPFILSTSDLLFSMGEKAKLRKLLISWRGEDFTPQQIDDFDLAAVVGKPCMINVVHRRKDDGEMFSVIDGVMRAPRGATIKEAANPLVTFWMAEGIFDRALVEAMGQSIRDKIHASPEWKHLTGQTKTPQTAPRPTAAATPPAAQPPQAAPANTYAAASKGGGQPPIRANGDWRNDSPLDDEIPF